MDANAIAAILALVMGLGYAAYLARDISKSWKKGRFLLRGAQPVERKGRPREFGATLLYNVVLMLASLAIAGFAAGRLLGWWSP